MRYLDKLRNFVQSYNNTRHRNLGMAPSQVNETNQEVVWQLLYGHDGGGKPIISKAKRQFKKGYMANWSEELFTITDALRSDPPMYRMADDHGEILDGTFYKPELQKASVPKNKRNHVSKRFCSGETCESVQKSW